jgi:hypothetical protein
MKIDWDEFERTRGEFKDGVRSDQEHPEQAYRRGVQQGANFVLEALEADRDAIDRKLLTDIQRYVDSALMRWRFGHGSRPRRLRRWENPPRVKRRRPRTPKSLCSDPDATRIDTYRLRGD